MQKSKIPFIAALVGLAATVNASLDKPKKFTRSMRHIPQERTEKGNAINPRKIVKNRAKKAGMTGKQFRRREKVARRVLKAERTSLPVALD